MRAIALATAIAVAATPLAGCVQPIPPEALQLSSESLEHRQRQTRRFDTLDEAKILAASAAVLQDLGFTLEESHVPLGLVVGSKDRDAVEAGQVAAGILIAVLIGVAMPIDKDQKIRVSLVTRPMTGETTGIATRVTFQRIVRNTQNAVSKIEGLNDVALYTEFFEKLSKAVFLEANQI